MTTTDLVFQRNDSGFYEASFVSQGKCVVELERGLAGTVSVFAGIPGMPRCHLLTIDPAWQPSAAVEVNVMSGMEVTVVSRTEVLSAKMAMADSPLLMD